MLVREDAGRFHGPAYLSVDGVYTCVCMRAHVHVRRGCCGYGMVAGESHIIGIGIGLCEMMEL